MNSLLMSIIAFLGHSSAEKPTGTAPQFTHPLESVEVSEGAAVKLACTVKGTPQPAIEWFKDGKPLKTSKRVIDDFDGEVASLSFAEADLDDEGDYKCVAQNESGSASCTAELLVNEPASKPEFTEAMKDIEVAEDEEGRFDVRVSGSPSPTVQWFKGTKKIEDAGKFILIDDEDDLFSLVIDKVASDDVGTYTCKANNEAGEVSCKAELKLQEQMAAPEFAVEEETGPITAVESGEVTLNVTVKGKPSPDVEWFKNDQPLRKTSRVDMKSRGDKFSAVIINVTPDDSGLYKCVASSKAGSVTRTFEVNIEGIFVELHHVSFAITFQFCLVRFFGNGRSIGVAYKGNKKILELVMQTGGSHCHIHLF